MFKHVGRLIGTSARDKKRKEKEFFAAVVIGEISIIDELIKFDDIDPNTLGVDALTALHIAAEKGDIAVGNYFLQLKDIDINSHKHARNGESPLITATIFNRMGFAALLLKYGANPNIQNRFGRTALHVAVIKKNLVMVKKLLFCHAQPNVCDAFDNTPLSLSVIEYPSKKVCELLLRWNADPNLRHVKTDSLMLELALNCKSLNQIELVKLLLNHGAQLNVVDSISHHSMLHMVAITGYLPLAKFLLELEKIDYNLKDTSGRTAYDVAVEHRNKDVANAFKEIIFKKNSKIKETKKLRSESSKFKRIFRSNRSVRFSEEDDNEK
ncbi:unnamed protein product [Ceutorhynchus assimilis]|uniref:Uncharacterized protein n=1 Tax=Ceutorhynchus assimilis TaxID=467358 RepID=A0A9N9MWV2_9CUCU|nr:unnamed protein product [Ceutorhynchus assimilis]